MAGRPSSSRTVVGHIPGERSLQRFIVQIKRPPSPRCLSCEPLAKLHAAATKVPRCRKICRGRWMVRTMTERGESTDFLAFDSPSIGIATKGGRNVQKQKGAGALLSCTGWTRSSAEQCTTIAEVWVPAGALWPIGMGCEHLCPNRGGNYVCDACKVPNGTQLLSACPQPGNLDALISRLQLVSVCCVDDCLPCVLVLTHPRRGRPVQLLCPDGFPYMRNNCSPP